MTRLEQVCFVKGGRTTSLDDPNVYDMHLTSAALMRLGAR